MVYSNFDTALRDSAYYREVHPSLVILVAMLSERTVPSRFNRGDVV